MQSLSFTSSGALHSARRMLGTSSLTEEEKGGERKEENGDCDNLVEQAWYWGEVKGSYQFS